MAQGTTDATGRATLQTGRGTFTIQASGPGLITATGHQIVLEDEHQTKTMVITMRAAGAAQGGINPRIVDEFGAPIAGVAVTAVNAATGDTASGATDANGKVSIALGRGTYTVTASKAGFVTVTGTVALTDAVRFMTGTFVMRPAAAQSSVVVKVVDENGNPLSGVTVTSSP